ncbi:MAG: TSUP family transporter [Clostridiales bacterium]|nr:TSUP family transporter [Clostridiales bacterium]
MDFSIFSLAGLILAGVYFVGGFIDAICGGGSLLTAPTLLSVGFPVQFITGTNQCATLPGVMTSLIRYAGKGHIHWQTSFAAACLAVPGAFLGARLNMILPAAILEMIMIVLVPLIAVFLLLKKDFGEENHIDELSVISRMGRAAVIGLVIGIYQGFYGAGCAAFMLLAFAVFDRLDVFAATGNTKFVLVCGGVSTAAAYIASGRVNWSAAVVGGVFNILGNYIGSAVAFHRGTKVVRPMFFLVLAILFARLAWSRIVG